MKEFILDNATSHEIFEAIKDTPPTNIIWKLGEVEMILESWESNTQDEERNKFTFERRIKTGFIISG